MNTPELPVLTLRRDRGWVDLRFSVLGREIAQDDEFHAIRAGSPYGSRDIAFNIPTPYARASKSFGTEPTVDGELGLIRF